MNTTLQQTSTRAKFDGQRTGACTELLRASREVIIDEIHRGKPEAGVAGVLRREQFKVYFAENLLWHNLFGLLFWDELFEVRPAA